jgi:phasin family protein
MDSKATDKTFPTDKAPDIKEIFDRFKLPNFDIDAFMATKQADIDAVTRATSIALAGAQSLAEKQAELLKSTLGEIGESLKSLPDDAKHPGELIGRQRDLVQSTLSKTLESMKEMAEAAQKSQAEIFEVASERVRTNVETVREMFRKER